MVITSDRSLGPRRENRVVAARVSARDFRYLICRIGALVEKAVVTQEDTGMWISVLYDIQDNPTGAVVW